MNLKTAILILLLSFCSLVQAQDLEWSGYFENQFFPQKINKRWLLQDYNKLRLDLSAEISEKVTFTADYIYRTYHGATTFNALDFIPAPVTDRYLNESSFPQEVLQSMLQMKLEDENFLDNAYVSIYTDRFNIRIGKQQLPWGAGYTWNPTDIFHQKNLLDPTYEKVGVNAFKLEIPFLKEGLFTCVLGIEREWKYSTKGLRIKQHFAGFDISGAFVEKHQDEFDYFTLSPYSQRRRMFGGNLSGGLLGLGVWLEGAYNRMEITGNFGQYLAGMDYTFENGLYLIGEYYHNELGKGDKQSYMFQDWMRLLSAQGENLGRDYLFIGDRYPVSELWNWSNFCIFNITDKSGIFFPWLDYSLSDNAEVLFVGYIPFGSSQSEFGEFGAGGFARIRVYF